MIKLEMEEQDRNIILNLLQRVTIQGSEVSAYIQAIKALNNIIKE